MKYVLTGSLHTDGDFYVDMDNFWNREFSKHFIHKEGSEFYYISLETEDIYYIRDFLEELIVSYRVGTHYWLVKDLYNFTEKILNVLFNDKIKYEESRIHGNYDGTELILTKAESK